MRLPPRAKLLLLCALFALPIVASLVVFHFFPPTGPTNNYGELLAPRPATEHAFTRPDGTTFGFAQLRGRWLLVASDSGACPTSCIQKLTAMRQVRLALGRKASRVHRVFVVDDLQRPLPAFEPFAGMDVAVTPQGLVLPPGAANDRAHIYLVDPRGTVMMRFPAAPDHKRMWKDLDRLLKASQIG